MGLLYLPDKPVFGLTRPYCPKYLVYKDYEENDSKDIIFPVVLRVSIIHHLHFDIESRKLVVKAL